MNSVPPPEQGWQARLVETIARAIAGPRADELVQAGNIIGEPCDYPAWMLAQPEARRVVAALEAQMIERLRIMSKQRKSSQMDEDDLESADWQGAYDWFCDESRAIYAALTKPSGEPS
jgi:hypothetical protein